MGRKKFDDLSEVLECWIPDQKSTPFSYELESNQMFDMNIRLYQRNLTYIAQIHSHPDEAFHSTIDDDYPILTKNGSYSIVIPNFAMDSTGLENCQCFRLDSGNWIPLNHETIEATFIIRDEDA